MGLEIGQWPWRFGHYAYHLIFPNLIVTSFMGYSFHVQVFEPTAVNLTTVHSRTVGVEFTDSTAVGAKMMEHIYAEGYAFTRKVVDENAGMCSKVQSGLENAARLAVFADGLEGRVRHFQNACLACTL